jgi:hypothetical protein
VNHSVNFLKSSYPHHLGRISLFLWRPRLYSLLSTWSDVSGTRGPSISDPLFFPPNVFSGRCNLKTKQTNWTHRAVGWDVQLQEAVQVFLASHFKNRVK